MMPISPNEAEERQTREHEDDYQYQLEKINKHLISGGRTVNRSGIPAPILERIMSEYRRAGWDVELIYDYRDGDFLQFKRNK